MIDTQEHAKYLNHTFGFNVIPMYYLIRDLDTAEKQVKMIDWQKYKAEPYPLDKWDDNYKALAIITGKISNLSVLDLDSTEAIDTLLDALGGRVEDLAEYVVQTYKGYQLFYTYEPNTSTRIGIKDKIDFLNGGLTFAVDTNPNYRTIKANQPAPMPQKLRDLIIDTQGQVVTESVKSFEQALMENSDLPYKFPLQPLIKEFIDAGKIGRNIKNNLEKVFCTKDYANYSLQDFAKKGQIHSSMMYVGGIVASNPTVSKELLIDFIEAWAKKVAKIDISDKREQHLIANRVKGCMKYFKYDPKWKQRAEELSNPINAIKNSGFDAWFNPATELYTFYNHTTKIKRDVSRPSIKEMLARKFNEEDGVTTYLPKNINTTLLPEKIETFDPTVDDTFYTDEYGHGVYNNFKRSKLLSYFQTCTPRAELPEFLGNIINHTYPNKEERDMFLHTLAYHMTYLQASPTCYILTGKSGTGKNILMQQVLQEIYGDMFLKMSAKDLTSRFRNQLKNKLLVFIDEVNEKGAKQAEQGTLHNVIKQVVANKEISIEAKGRDTETYPNHALFTMASNRDQPFKLEEGFDRRINITKTKNENLRDLDWFPSHLPTHEIDEIIIKEVPAFVEYLASIELQPKLWAKTLDNVQRKSLISSSVPVVQQYTTAIMDKDYATLHDLDIDFAEWYETKKDMASISTSELKMQLGDIGAKVIKQLQIEGVKKKKVNNKWALFLNPKGTDKPVANVEGV